MSIIRARDFKIENSPYPFLEMDDNCFVCGKLLSTPFVFWNGPVKNACFHPACAGSFGGAMTRDFLEVGIGKGKADSFHASFKRLVTKENG